MPAYTYTDVAHMIDHSLLQPTLTDAEMEQGCRLAREYAVASVCIKPYAVRQAAERSGVIFSTWQGPGWIIPGLLAREWS